MGLGSLVEKVLTRNIKYDVTNSQTGEQASFTIVTDGGPGMYPGWGYGAYRGLLGIPAADRAMTLIAGLLGQVTWQGYRRVSGRRPVKLDPNPMVLDQPAGTMEIPLRTYYGWAMDRMAHGNGIGLVASRGMDGWPTSFLPVGAESVGVKRVAQNDPEVSGFRVGEIAYRVNGRWYRAEDVIHFKGPSEPGALRGMGILENHFATLDRARKLDTQAGAVDSSGVPTGLLKSLNPDLTKTEADELKAAWKNAQVTRTVAVLNPSTEYESIAWNPTELQLLEARRYTLTEWADIFGIDASFLGGDSASNTYANIVEKGADLLKFGRPGELVEEFSQTLTMALPRGQVVKPDLEFLLRADKKTRYEVYAGAITAGWMTPTEARAAEDMEPLTAAQQDEIDRARGKAQQQLATGTGTPGEVAPASPALAMAATRAQLDLLVALLERRFDPSQPRDSEGKFAETGASFFSGHGGVQRLPSAGEKLGTGAKATVRPIDRPRPAADRPTFKPARVTSSLPPRVAAALADAKRQGLARKPRSTAEVNRIAVQLDVPAPDPSASRGWRGDQWGAYWATVIAGGDAGDGIKAAGQVGSTRSEADVLDLIVRTLEEARPSFGPEFDPGVEPDRSRPRLVEARDLELRLAAVEDLGEDDEPDPVITEIDEAAVLRPDELVDELGDEHDRVDGRDGAYLHEYWTAGAGLARWAKSSRPWRSLRRFLSKYLSGKKLDATTSAWYRDVFGHLPGQD